MPAVRGGGPVKGVNPSGPAIAGDAMKYVGHPYAFGGIPGSDGKNPWDCSSFVNWVLGHDFKMRLPGTLKPGYNGTSHGPSSVMYASWKGAKLTKTPQAGDLCIWLGTPIGHIGIATSPTHMVSALNPGLGTLRTPIQGEGPAGATLIFKTISGVVSGPATGCIPGTALIAKLMRLTWIS